MCDTQIIRTATETWFAKNSDREPSEAQLVCYLPPVRNDTAAEVATTYISIPQVPDRHGVILSRPAWIWGAEMGVNDRGVVIGNEAVFTRLVDRKGRALLGMDLLRLALERAVTAREALECITGLLQAHGQGGPAGYRDKSFRYDNSFLIADGREAWILETAGRHWAAKRVGTLAAISNAHTIGTEFDLCSAGLVDCARESGLYRGRGQFDFAATFDTRFMKFMGCAAQRRQSSLDSLAGMARPSVPAMAASLRRHHRESGGFSGHGNRDVCMHAGGLTRPSQTCGSMIVKLAEGEVPQVWVTGTSAPCLSLFQPVDFSGASAAICAEHGDAQQSLWAQFEPVHRRALRDSSFRNQLRSHRDRIEAEVLAAAAQGTPIGEISDIAESWHRHWHDQAAIRAPHFRWYSAYERYWKKLDRLDTI
ncbi:C69 family dipeptidase [Microbulbifer hainanensis]|uniref:C69 family dipeptidase n=1 Tax=Microbulbifer hainanensis TaxID=2735675 RepID=UPI0018693323|nr:C69 family dipeptidase [Microbulbifer hainanensis]